MPVDSNADPEDKAASTAGLTTVRKSLLPENALSARFTTTAGPDLKQVSGTVYVGSHEGTGGEQRILWVKVGDQMYPTGKSSLCCHQLPCLSCCRSHCSPQCSETLTTFRNSEIATLQLVALLMLTRDSVHSLAQSQDRATTLYPALRRREAPRWGRSHDTWSAERPAVPKEGHQGCRRSHRQPRSTHCTHGSWHMSDRRKLAGKHTRHKGTCGGDISLGRRRAMVMEHKQQTRS